MEATIRETEGVVGLAQGLPQNIPFQRYLRFPCYRLIALSF